MTKTLRTWEDWHKVKEFPPEHGELVWVAHSGHPNEPPYLAKRTYDLDTVDQDKWVTDMDAFVQAPTYWHPLVPPKHPELRK